LAGTLAQNPALLEAARGLADRDSGKTLAHHVLRGVDQLSANLLNRTGIEDSEDLANFIESGAALTLLASNFDHGRSIALARGLTALAEGLGISDSSALTRAPPPDQRQ
jgi:short-subunit dehydrogenase involved in D-alanine esterification of teichoic acids